MKTYWKLFLGLLLLLAAVLIYTLGYMPAKQEYENQRAQLQESIGALQEEVMENRDYVKVQEQIPAALEALEETRRELYGKFPVEMREEEQLMYVIYLEELFGTEISFDFGATEELVELADGAAFEGLNITMKFPCSYDEFCQIVSHLAANEKLTSVHRASVAYDPVEERMEGKVTIVRYLLEPESAENVPETGADNIIEEN